MGLQAWRYGARAGPSRVHHHHFQVCVESLIFSMAQIALFKVFYIFTFYLAESNTIFYLRADPTTTLSLFLYKVQCFIPPVAGGSCYCVQWWASDELLVATVKLLFIQVKKKYSNSHLMTSSIFDQ